MKVLLFATDRALRDEYASALRAAGLGLVTASTSAEALEALSLRPYALVLVEGRAPAAARGVLRRACRGGVTTVWCANAPPVGFNVMHATSADDAARCVQRMPEAKATSVLLVGVDPDIAEELRCHGAWVHEADSSARLDDLPEFDHMIVGDGSLEAVQSVVERGGRAKRVLVMRASDQARSLIEALDREGGRSVLVSGMYPAQTERPTITRELAEGALVAEGGNRTAAARSLGISRELLRYYVKR